jgi:hypothetical protein
MPRAWIGRCWPSGWEGQGSRQRSRLDGWRDRCQTQRGPKGGAPEGRAPRLGTFRTRGLGPQGGPLKWVVSTGMDRLILGNWAGNFDWGSVANRKSAGEIALAVFGEAR